MVRIWGTIIGAVTLLTLHPASSRWSGLVAVLWGCFGGVLRCDCLTVTLGEGIMPERPRR